MKRSTSLTAATRLALLAVLLTHGTVTAQESAAQPKPAGAATSDGDRPRPVRGVGELQRFREQMRKHVQQRIDNTRRNLNRLEQTMKMIEAGADTAEIKAAIDSLNGENRRNDRQDQANVANPPVVTRPNAQAGGGDKSGMGLVGLDAEPVRPLSPDEREEILVLFREHDPEIAQQLTTLQGRSVALYERTVDSLAPRVRLIREAKSRNDQVMIGLRLEDIRNTMAIFRLAFAYAQARGKGDTAAEQRIEGEMRTALGKQFDTRLAIRRRELDQLTQRVAAMKSELDTLEGRKEQIIDNVKGRGMPGMGGKGSDKKRDKDTGETPTEEKRGG